MAMNRQNEGRRHGGLWRWAMWGSAAALLLLPAVAMRVGNNGVNWTGSDFAVFGTMLLIACGACELGVWLSRDRAYRAGFGVAVVAGFLLTWINLAVGIIGSEDNLANGVFFGVLLVGAIGALVARFKPQGMARALVVTAIAQALAGVVALIQGSVEGVGLSAFFAVVWLGSAALFRKAAR